MLWAKSKTKADKGQTSSTDGSSLKVIIKLQKIEECPDEIDSFLSP